MHTLAIFLRADEKNDRDMWFAESISELVEAAIQEFGCGRVGGFGRGGDLLEIWATISETSSPETVEHIEQILKQHCGPETRVYEVITQDKEDDGEGVERSLFAKNEDIPQRELPLSSPKYAYSQFTLAEKITNNSLEQEDRYVFKNIACSGKTNFENLLFWVNEYSGMTKERLNKSLERLQQAKYIHEENGIFRTSDSLNEHLPKTAMGNVSSLREDAWRRVYTAFFS